MGGVESSFVSDIYGADVKFGNNAFTLCMEEALKPDIFIDNQMT